MKRRLLGWLMGTGLLLLAIVNTGCASVRAGNQTRTAIASAYPSSTPLLVTPTERVGGFVPATRAPGETILTPTPNPPRPLPTLRSEAEYYTVQAQDTLASIARRYGLSLNTLMLANQITNPDFLMAGQVLLIPPPEAGSVGSEFKIIPDSELVYSPSNADFDAQGFIEYRNGYLAKYSELVDEEELTGAEILLRVAQENSVNPRLLLTVLEYESGWVTMENPPSNYMVYPMGYYNAYYDGLYKQLSWAANELCRGYYLWKGNGLAQYYLADGGVIRVGETINAGTAGVQQLMSLLSYSRVDWDRAVSAEGVFTVYQDLFGYPFDYSFDPLLPVGLRQPNFILPFEAGNTWSFTGGPHGGWADGSGWAALDFAPPGESMGCVVSDAWVTAIADGIVVRSENGMVLQDLDRDGLEQTGWTILYLHVDSFQRVEPGQYLRAGDRIGHPSCEGGVSFAAHLHIARRYNGEWIPADGDLPFNLEGWISEGTGIAYDGYLRKGDTLIEAWDAFLPENQIGR